MQGNTSIAWRAFALAVIALAISDPNVFSSDDAVASNVKADETLMLRLRREIEAIPPAEREAKGVQILVDNVDNFITAEARRRVYLSIGDIYHKRGELHKAIPYHRKAGASDGPASALAAVSQDHLMESLEKKREFAKLLEIALRLREAPGLSASAYATLTHRAGVALAGLGRTEAAVEIVMKGATDRPSERMYQALETVSIAAGLHKDKASELRGMRWLNRESGEFGRSYRFLGNLAHSEEYGGSIEESLRIRKGIVRDYADKKESAHHVEKIVTSRFNKGDGDEARTYCIMILDGEYADNYKLFARRMLSILDGKKVGVSGDTVMASGGYLRVLLSVNIVVVLALAIVIWVRRSNKSI